MKTRLPTKQKGAAAIEFALVFVIFFAVLYGVVSYSLPLLLVQSFNNATAEAARRGMAVDPETKADYAGTVKKVTEEVLEQKLGWVRKIVKTALEPDGGYDTSTREIYAKVNLNTNALKSIMPVLKLGVITVPDLPEYLTAESRIQVENFEKQ